MEKPKEDVSARRIEIAKQWAESIKVISSTDDLDVRDEELEKLEKLAQELDELTSEPEGS